MPRRKKKPIEWTTDETMKKLFPKKVREELNRVAHEKENKCSSSQEHINTEDT